MNPLDENRPDIKQTPSAKTSAEDRIASIFVGPQGIRAGWRWLIFLAIVLLCTGLLIVVCAAVGLLKLPAPGAAPTASLFTVSAVLTQEITLVIAMVVAAAIMSKIEKRPMGQYGLPARQAFGRLFWQGVVWGFVAITLCLMLVAALHGVNLGSPALFGSALIGYAVAWGIAFLLTGFTEEFIFRGYSQFTLTSGIRFWPAAIILSILFGCLHLGNPGESWPGALSAALIGFFFCFTLRRTGTIWFAVGLHAAWDYGQTFVYGVPDSGLAAPGHFLNATFHGPAWLTGGTVGPEASVACFVVLGLLFLIFHFSYPARASNETTE
ncbi:MAG TPA: CPBP family intramembrane glutamic endopeptidase [Candidatus Acidoferrales bacterium]|nr:CPBP family intramembrane glutamic endopeptidase [Candidatus Acidoferrales bacterium]